ncbi:hypothetical protein, partial [Paremcibacter congregatus]|uniref:hypothetical protein n=1 Tax=Paremcibacter congregatus TaxID=2043170 RepID=UPI0030EB22CE
MVFPSFIMLIETLMPVSKNRRKNKNKKKKMPVKVKKKAAVASSSPLPDRRTLEKMMAQITAAAASPDMFASGSLGGDGLFDDYADNKVTVHYRASFFYFSGGYTA